MTLNPKRWAMYFVKKVAIWAINEKLDELQAQVKDGVAKRGPKAIDHAFDGAQARMNKAVGKACPKWKWLCPLLHKVTDEVNDLIDRLQVRVKSQVLKKGPKIIDRLFDEAQEILSERVLAI